VSSIIDSCRPREGTFNPEIFTASLSQVISHYATPVVPVDASELSRVQAKRLFLPIDPTAAKIAAAMYGELYARSSAALPDEVVQARITRPVSSGSRSGPERGTHPERWLRRHRCAREGE
jgi:hypothetical protein